jgi:hypothetical protein
VIERLSTAMRILLTCALVAAVSCPLADAATTHRAISHPTARTSVVLRVTTGGGFVAPQTNLRAQPSFTLYGDGSVIVPGAVTQMFPGPAIGPLVRRQLSERQVQALLRRARQAGLLAPRAIDYGDMGSVGVSDGPTTTLVVNAGARHVTREAYALGIGAGAGRLTAAQVEARKALAQFVASLPQRPSGSRYAPHAIAVYVAPAASPLPAAAGRVVWPLASNLATAGKPVANGPAYRCITVAGKDVGTLLARLRSANEQSRWTMRGRPGRTYELIARPLLPDERGCSVTHS